MCVRASVRVYVCVCMNVCMRARVGMSVWVRECVCVCAIFVCYHRYNSCLSAVLIKEHSVAVVGRIDAIAYEP